MISRLASRPAATLLAARARSSVRCQHSQAELLADVRRSFPDTQDLHPRIDLLLNNPQQTVRVAILPFHVHRNNIKATLDAVIADPLASDLEWYDALKNRLLGKNTSIRYSSTFDKNTITHNSLVEYAVPFAVPTNERLAAEPNAVKEPREIEILECNNYKDSLDHLRPCHRHVYVCDDARIAHTKPLPINYPADLFLDLPDGKSFGKVRIVDSAKAVKASDLLRESPTNAGEYATLYNESNISDVQYAVFGRNLQESEKQVLATIVETCEGVVSREEQVAYEITHEASSLSSKREQWASEAHHELQTTFTKALNELVANKLVWWKLYYKVDDVYNQASTTLMYYFLPRTQDRFDYLLGRIDQFASTHYFPPLPPTTPATADAGISKTEQISSLFTNARTSLINDLAVDLHNTALRELLKTLVGVQLPLVLLPLFGVYFFDYSLYGAGSLMALGVVMGASRLERAWKRATDGFVSAALARAKDTVDVCERGIWDRWQLQVQNQQAVSKSRKQLIERLKNE